MTTLTQYLNNHSSNTAINETITTITEVGKTIAQLLRRGALADILGEAGNQNVQGEEQKKLDVLANDLLPSNIVLSLSPSLPTVSATPS